MTDTQQNDGPPFLADLADDAAMTGTILAKPLKGKDVISQVIRSIASCYVSQSMSGHACRWQHRNNRIRRGIRVGRHHPWLGDCHAPCRR